jgi:hypothetical protein
MSRISSVIGVLVIAFMFSGPAKAVVTLNVNGDGQLIGADNVDLGSLGIFNVEFLEGTCVEHFTGCDNADDDFDFHNAVDPVIAAQALLDQVFVDGDAGLFDSDPTLTFGCSSSDLCVSFIPKFLFFVGDPTDPSNLPRAESTISMNQSSSTNRPEDSVDRGAIVNLFDTRDGDQDFVNFVRFTFQEGQPVPEPGTLALFGVSIIGLAAIRRRRNHSVH